ncbi:MAG: acyl-CoA dehydrogenase family protein [Terricaulis sp.]
MTFKHFHCRGARSLRPLWTMEEMGILFKLEVRANLTMEFSALVEAMQIMGGASYVRGCRVERIYREVRINAIGGGSEEIMRDLAARQLGI